MKRLDVRAGLRHKERPGSITSAYRAWGLIMNYLAVAQPSGKSKRLRASWGVDPSVTVHTARSWFHGSPCHRCQSTVRFVSSGECVRCNKQSRNQNRKKNARQGKRQWRSPVPAITREVFAAIETAQGNACAICKQPEKVREQRLTIDHCHNTGKFRGLLCNRCNRGIGLFMDSPERLKAALDYIENNPWDI